MRKQDGKLTEPTLPSKLIASGGGVTIEHYYRSRDHGYAHLHVKGEGQETRIGQNGKAAFRDPDPTSAQQAVIDANKAAIRQAVKKIGRWLVFKKQKK